MRASLKLDSVLSKTFRSIHFSPRSSFPLSMSRYVFPVVVFPFRRADARSAMPRYCASSARRTRTAHPRTWYSRAVFYFLSMKLKVHFLPRSSSITVCFVSSAHRGSRTQVSAVGKLTKVKLHLRGPLSLSLFLSPRITCM